MQVSVESPSKIEKRITVIVPPERVEEAVNAQLAVFAKKTEIKGFRPGKVPLNYIKQRFGQDVRNEAISSVVQKTLNEAIIKENLYPISTPRVEMKEIVPGKSLEYTAIFEVLPEIGTIQFAVDKLEKRVAKILDQDVDQTIERLREQHVTWAKADRPGQEKDKVSGKIQMFMEDGSPMTPESMPLEFVLKNEASVFGWNLLEKLQGAKAGDEVKFSHTLPQESFLQGMQGKTLEFKIEVQEISEPELPAIDGALAKKLGIKSGEIEELRDEIRKQLELNLNRTITSQLKEQIFEKLIEQNPLEVPPAMIEREAKHLHDENCSMAGHGNHNHSKEDEVYFAAIAKKRIQLGLLVGEVAKQNKMKPDAERVNQRIIEIASVYADPAEFSNRLKADKRRLKEIETSVIEDQVVDKLLENVSIAEKEVSYENLISHSEVGSVTE